MGSSIDAARAAWSAQRHDETAGLRGSVQAIVSSGVTTLGGIARVLQAQGARTPAGTLKWHRAQVARLMPEPTVTSNARAAEIPTSPNLSPALVLLAITANNVWLPVESDDTVGPAWENAERTAPVNRGRWLRVPPDLAELLEYRRQAVRIQTVRA